MNKSEKKMRLEMIKAIGDRKKVGKENERLKALIIKMACCGNCYHVTRNCMESVLGKYCDKWIFKK